jgi:hypothetical protein
MLVSMWVYTSESGVGVSPVRVRCPAEECTGTLEPYCREFGPECAKNVSRATVLAVSRLASFTNPRLLMIAIYMKVYGDGYHPV